MASSRSRRRLRFFFEKDLADLFKELGIDVLAFGGLVAGGDGAVAAAAAATTHSTTEAAAEATAISAAAAAARRAVVAVTGWGLGAGARHQR